MKRAFSLVDTICAVAIVAILAALVFPAFVSVRRGAAISSCMANLRQIGQATLMYAADNENLIQPWATSRSGKTFDGYHFDGDVERWRTALMVYGVGAEQFWCPLDRKRGREFFAYNEPPTSRRWEFTSYMVNPTLDPRRFGSRDGVFRLSVTDLPSDWLLSPSETVYLSDAFWDDPTAPEGVNPLTGLHDRDRRVNALYLDGSVKKGLVEDL